MRRLQHTAPCRICTAAFDPETWVANRSKPTGYEYHCRACHREIAAKRRADQVSRMRKAWREWAHRNKEARASVAAARRTQARIQVSWANEPAIRGLYATARWLRSRGLDIQVDHIVPLRGATVWGLHVYCNLRLSFARANRSKGASTWPDSGHQPGQFCRLTWTA